MQVRQILRTHSCTMFGGHYKQILILQCHLCTGHTLFDSEKHTNETDHCRMSAKISNRIVSTDFKYNFRWNKYTTHDYSLHFYQHNLPFTKTGQVFPCFFGWQVCRFYTGQSRSSPPLLPPVTSTCCDDSFHCWLMSDDFAKWKIEGKKNMLQCLLQTQGIQHVFPIYFCRWFLDRRALPWLCGLWHCV